MKRREEARLMAELVQSSDSSKSSDSEEERKRKRHRKKGKKSKHGHKKRLVGVCSSVCLLCSTIGVYHLPRSKKRRKKVQSSSDSESEGGEEGVWVEKKIKRDTEDAFVGPVPEIRVQANVNKKEYVPTLMEDTW